MPDPENGGYQVHYSKAVGDDLRKLQRQATRRGQGKAFLSAFRRIVRALQRDPNAVGEPLYNLPNLRLDVRTVVIVPLVIDFAVSQDHYLVFIKSGRLLSSPEA
jgi:hypothetical protein